MDSEIRFYVRLVAALVFGLVTGGIALYLALLSDSANLDRAFAMGLVVGVITTLLGAWAACGYLPRLRK